MIIINSLKKKLLYIPDNSAGSEVKIYTFYGIAKTLHHSAFIFLTKLNT